MQRVHTEEVSGQLAEAEAAHKAGDHGRAGRHESLAASYRAVRDQYQAQEHTFAQAMADRAEWEHTTGHTRHLAIGADAELRRRYPVHTIGPLRSADATLAAEATASQPPLSPPSPGTSSTGPAPCLPCQAGRR